MKTFLMRKLVSVTLNPCIDRVLFVDAVHLGENNPVRHIERDAGGKGINLARVYRKLGGSVVATGFLGGYTGAEIAAVLDREKVVHDFIHIPAPNRASTLIESGGVAATVFSERGPAIREEDYKALLQELELLLPGASWLTLGGSIPPGVPSEVFRDLAVMGHRYGAKVLLDADGDALASGLKGLPDLIKPNVAEAERYLGKTLKTVREQLSAAEELRLVLKKTKLSRLKTYEPIVIISAGAHGAVMSCEDGLFMGESPKVVTRSTIGSGDSMLGAFLWAVESGYELSRSLAYGLAAGAATAITNGSEIASRSMIMQLLPEAKVVAANDEQLRPGRSNVVLEVTGTHNGH